MRLDFLSFDALLGLREGTGGTVGPAYQTNNGNITALSDLGKRVLVHALTHKTYDFAEIPDTK
jgi:hypothetical protein